MKIEIAELNRLLLRNREIIEELKTTFTNLSNELEDICGLIKSSGLNEANTKFMTYTQDVNARLQTSLNNIVTFLETQIKEYDTTNIDAEGNLEMLQSTLTFDSI